MFYLNDDLADLLNVWNDGSRQFLPVLLTSCYVFIVMLCFVILPLSNRKLYFGFRLFFKLWLFLSWRWVIWLWFRICIFFLLVLVLQVILVVSDAMNESNLFSLKLFLSYSPVWVGFSVSSFVAFSQLSYVLCKTPLVFYCRDKVLKLNSFLHKLVFSAVFFHQQLVVIIIFLS